MGGKEIWLVGRELKHFTTLWLRKCEPSTGGSHFENEKREGTRKVAINPSDLFSSPLANLPSNNPRLFLSFFHILKQSPPIPCTVVECQGLLDYITSLSLKMSRRL